MIVAAGAALDLTSAGELAVWGRSGGGSGSGSGSGSGGGGGGVFSLVALAQELPQYEVTPRLTASVKAFVLCARRRARCRRCRRRHCRRRRRPAGHQLSPPVPCAVAAASPRHIDTKRNKGRDRDKDRTLHAQQQRKQVEQSQGAEKHLLRTPLPHTPAAGRAA